MAISSNNGCRTALDDTYWFVVIYRLRKYSIFRLAGSDSIEIAVSLCGWIFDDAAIAQL